MYRAMLQKQQHIHENVRQLPVDAILNREGRNDWAGEGDQSVHRAVWLGAPGQS